MNGNANRFLVINSELSDITNNSVTEARDSTFFEDVLSFRTRIPSYFNTQPSSI